MALKNRRKSHHQGNGQIKRFKPGTRSNETIELSSLIHTKIKGETEEAHSDSIIIIYSKNSTDLKGIRFLLWSTWKN